MLQKIPFLLSGFCLAASWAAAASDPTIPPPPKVPAKVDKPQKNFSQSLPGSQIKIEMVFIPGGEYLMGSPASEEGHQPDESPQVRVKVRPFWLAKFECTWDEFDEWWKTENLMKVDDLPPEKARPDAITRPTNPYVDELYDHGRNGFPAICMTHHAAMMYCHWLRSKTGLPYRLPTEAEWEYAARAGSTGKYCCKDSEIGDYAWYKANSADEDHDKGTTHKVGTKKANAFGLHDMHGNVWEWCLDHYDPKGYARLATDKLNENVFVRPTDKKWSHVVRGGSWTDTPDKLRSAAKRGSDKSWMKHDPQLPQSIWWLTKMDNIGFRVALPVDEYPGLLDLKPMVEKKPD
ncbi:MAG: SUMF1/EgtB/PvdO family nonheme iron enzyme [Gemmataceae bacterium]